VSRAVASSVPCWHPSVDVCQRLWLLRCHVVILLMCVQGGGFFVQCWHPADVAGLGDVDAAFVLHFPPGLVLQPCAFVSATVCVVL
jgi:hypothetical protein